MVENLQPLEDRVIIRPLEMTGVRKSGLIIPETAKEQPQEGEVIAIGPGRTLKDGTRAPMSVKVGATVIFARYGGTEIKLEGEKLFIMPEYDILAIKGAPDAAKRKPKAK